MIIIIAVVSNKRENALDGPPRTWWRRFTCRARSFFCRDEIGNRLRKAERALEATYLDKPQAEANNLQAEGAASLIGALNGTDNACIQVGSLLLVKATGSDGRAAVVARTLTADELTELEENQAILREPGRILEFLQEAERRRIT